MLPLGLKIMHTEINEILFTIPSLLGSFRWLFQIAHGSYDNWCDGHGFVWDFDYCAGGCGYWDDFRWHDRVSPSRASLSPILLRHKIDEDLFSASICWHFDKHIYHHQTIIMYRDIDTWQGPPTMKQSYIMYHVQGHQTIIITSIIMYHDKGKFHLCISTANTYVVKLST